MTYEEHTTERLLLSQFSSVPACLQQLLNCCLGCLNFELNKLADQMPTEWEPDDLAHSANKVDSVGQFYLCGVWQCAIGVEGRNGNEMVCCGY